jgi:hypothetical protein
MSTTRTVGITVRIKAGITSLIGFNYPITTGGTMTIFVSQGNEPFTTSITVVRTARPRGGIANLSPIKVTVTTARTNTNTVRSLEGNASSTSCETTEGSRVANFTNIKHSITTLGASTLISTSGLGNPTRSTTRAIASTVRTGSITIFIIIKHSITTLGTSTLSIRSPPKSAITVPTTVPGIDFRITILAIIKLSVSAKTALTFQVIKAISINTSVTSSVAVLVREIIANFSVFHIGDVITTVGACSSTVCNPRSKTLTSGGAMYGVNGKIALLNSWVENTIGTSNQAR